MGRCWRLTCPTNGAPYGLLELVRPAEDVSSAPTLFDRVKSESEANGRRVLAGFVPFDPDKWDHTP